ncbi:NAD(P)-dependent oxidoreductase [Kineococcus sp. TRM81007]|uniref:NAD-dependent epimerase/dehydratase family protein n=1 Tax=Kineococcus sp. TRM81007 TaxID=2925831 RepID=UPI001F56EA78|nr:NAD(P)-dependent oxidoreductase [Kineococcus sp. TRM81007]MCI2239828.1 NAD(P)-dependent oxidoreductase [Kineococcus sp. TRM81007]
MSAAPQHVLVTGAAGTVGTLVAPRLAAPGRVLTLTDLHVPDPPPAAPAGAGEVRWATLSVTDPDALEAALEGVDAVVHLGGISREAPWQEVLSVNVDGTRNLLEAAVRRGVRRVVLASSNHAVGYRSRDEAVDGYLPADAPVRPDSYYGWSKAAIEALGRLYSDHHGLQVCALRIGSCFPDPGRLGVRGLSTWLSPDDCVRLLEASVTDTTAGYTVVWGVSRNTRGWFSLAEGEAIGYHPRDDSEEHAGLVLTAGEEPDVRSTDLFHVGGASFLDNALGRRN